VTIAPIMLWTLLIALAAFTLLYLYLMSLRLRVGRLEERAVAEALSPRIGQPVGELMSEVDAEPPRHRDDAHELARSDPLARTADRESRPHA
jgi:hypothetical protein